MGLTKLTLLTKEETMTSRDLSIFNTLRPFSIGFDDMFDQFENMLGNGGLTMQSITRLTTLEKLEKTTMLLKLLWLVLIKMMLRLSLKTIY